uniref:Uncharacterized protein n=1 Tax=Manihot esculenta TaxID=3983 RepID=A0A2C9VUS7_MANES
MLDNLLEHGHKCKSKVYPESGKQGNISRGTGIKENFSLARGTHGGHHLKYKSSFPFER